MLFPIVLFAFNLFSYVANADDFSDMATAARESRNLYESQKALSEGSALSDDIQEILDVYYTYLETPQPEAQAKAREIVETARDYSTDERRKSIFSKGTVVGGISNELFAEAEEARRKELGLDKEDQLYIFISRSMPDELIRSYALDAAYSGGILVMRGIGDKERLADFLRSEYMKNIKPDGMGAMVQLDPRLFDAFGIEVVPSIVYTNQSLAELCIDHGSTSQRCTPSAEDSFYKIAGSVTVKYALERFVQEGAGEGAERFISTLKKGYQTGSVENPNHIAGIGMDEYKAFLNQIIQPEPARSDFIFEQGSNHLRMQTINTPFGPIDAPAGTQLLLKNIGGMEAVLTGEVSAND